MMNVHPFINLISSILCLVAIMSSCKNNSTSEPLKIDSTNETIKPPSSYNDTFKITQAAAVLYIPDSLQLEKIKSLTSDQIFEGQMHEYEYQLKYSKKVLHNEWPKIKLLEPKNVRFLLFQSSLGEVFTIDLNDYNDPYGIILFNGTSKPVLADMTNFEQAVYQHFKE